MPENTTPGDPTQDLQKRDLLIDLVLVAQSLGHLPSSEEIDEHSEYSTDRFQDEFGDLFAAFQAAGIVPDTVTRRDYLQTVEPGSDVNDTGENIPDGSFETPTRSQLINELRSLNEATDEIPSPEDLKNHGKFEYHSYQSEFGSWDTALDAANIDIEERFLEDVGRVAAQVDRIPSQSDMSEHGIYGAVRVARFFGDWETVQRRYRKWESAQSNRNVDSNNEFNEAINNALDDILD